MKLKTKLIIFDIDGTLVDAYPAIISSFNYVMERLGYPKQNLKVIRRAVGWGDRNLLMPFIRKKDSSSAFKIYRSHHRNALKELSCLLPHVEKVLSYLKGKGIKIAIASNRPTAFSLLLLKHLKIYRFVDYLLCADKLKKGKPHPEILWLICRKLKTPLGESLYVGDMVIDAQAALNAGMRFVLVTTGSHNYKELKEMRPYRIFKDIMGLKRIV